MISPVCVCGRVWYLGDGGKVLRDDEENFMDPSGRVVIVTEERNIGVGR